MSDDTDINEWEGTYHLLDESLVHVAPSPGKWETDQQTKSDHHSNCCSNSTELGRRKCEFELRG